MAVGISILCAGDKEYDYLKNLLMSLRERAGDVFITITSNDSSRVKKFIEKSGAHWNYFKWCNDFSKARQYGL